MENTDKSGKIPYISTELVTWLELVTDVGLPDVRKVDTLDAIAIDTAIKAGRADVLKIINNQLKKQTAAEAAERR